jgi:hypothetical protein
MPQNAPERPRQVETAGLLPKENINQLERRLRETQAQVEGSNEGFKGLVTTITSSDLYSTELKKRASDAYNRININLRDLIRGESEYLNVQAHNLVLELNEVMESIYKSATLEFFRNKVSAAKKYYEDGNRERANKTMEKYQALRGYINDESFLSEYENPYAERILGSMEKIENIFQRLEEIDSYEQILQAEGQIQELISKIQEMGSFLDNLETITMLEYIENPEDDTYTRIAKGNVTRNILESISLETTGEQIRAIIETHREDLNLAFIADTVNSQGELRVNPKEIDAVIKNAQKLNSADSSTLNPAEKQQREILLAIASIPELSRFLLVNIEGESEADEENIRKTNALDAVDLAELNQATEKIEREERKVRSIERDLKVKVERHVEFLNRNILGEGERISQRMDIFDQQRKMVNALGAIVQISEVFSNANPDKTEARTAAINERIESKRFIVRDIGIEITTNREGNQSIEYKVNESENETIRIPNGEEEFVALVRFVEAQRSSFRSNEYLRTGREEYREDFEAIQEEFAGNRAEQGSEFLSGEEEAEEGSLEGLALEKFREIESKFAEIERIGPDRHIEAYNQSINFHKELVKIEQGFENSYGLNIREFRDKPELTEKLSQTIIPAYKNLSMMLATERLETNPTMNGAVSGSLEFMSTSEGFIGVIQRQLTAIENGTQDELVTHNLLRGAFNIQAQIDGRFMPMMDNLERSLDAMEFIDAGNNPLARNLNEKRREIRSWISNMKQALSQMKTLCEQTRQLEVGDRTILRPLQTTAIGFGVAMTAIKLAPIIVGYAAIGGAKIGIGGALAKVGITGVGFQTAGVGYIGSIAGGMITGATGGVTHKALSDGMHAITGIDVGANSYAEAALWGAAFGGAFGLGARVGSSISQSATGQRIASRWSNSKLGKSRLFNRRGVKSSSTRGVGEKGVTEGAELDLGGMEEVVGIFDMGASSEHNLRRVLPL